MFHNFLMLIGIIYLIFGFFIFIFSKIEKLSTKEAIGLAVTWPLWILNEL